MVLVHNKGAQVLVLPGEIAIPPGGKEVSEKAWEAAMKHKMVAFFIENDILEVHESSLASIPARKAAAIVADTYDPKQLEEWAKDKRSSVRRKAQQNLEEINGILERAQKGEAPENEGDPQPDIKAVTVSTTKPV